MNDAKPIQYATSGVDAKLQVLQLQVDSLQTQADALQKQLDLLARTVYQCRVALEDERQEAKAVAMLVEQD